MFHRLFRDQRGMTLAEVVVSLVIAAALFVAMGGIYLYSAGVFTRYAGESDRQQTADSVIWFLRDELGFAAYMEVSFDGNPNSMANHVICFRSNGRVYYDGKALFSRDYFESMRLVIQMHPEEDEAGYVFDYEIILRDADGEARYSVRSAVRLLNMEAEDRDIQYPDMGDGHYFPDSSQRDLYIYYYKY